MASLLLALIYLAFISLGLPDSLLGSGWPVIHLELNVPVSYMGIVTMIISGGTIISSLLADRLIHKFGTAAVTVVSVFLTAVALVGFSFCTKFWMLLVLGIPYGLGAGAIDAALNNYVALHYSSRHMSWLHCFWGVGTIVSPFVMSYALTNATWNDGYLIVGILQSVIGVVLLATLPVWKKTGHEGLQATEQKAIGLFGALKIKGVPFLLLGFLCYCAAESTAMNWASTFFVEVKHIPEAQAAQFASLFYIGMTVGRFLSGFIAGKLGDRRLILLGACIAATQDKTRLSKINGYGSKTFAARQIFSIIHNNSTPTNEPMNAQLPANFAIASAARCPNETFAFATFAGFTDILLPASNARISSSVISCLMSLRISLISSLLFFMFFLPVVFCTAFLRVDDSFALTANV